MDCVNANFQSQFPVAITGFKATPPVGRCRAARISACFASAEQLPMMRNGLDAILLPTFLAEMEESGSEFDSGVYLNGGHSDNLILRQRDMAPFAWA